eukprot:INCI12857.1.p1 GENE.INCI12857.1~~INCI12857.1.p1  ORF type:complete len:428 (+),score=64.17 INCI12857.1:353-1636(+)
MADLLSPPPASEGDYENATEPIVRTQGNYKPTYQRFVVGEADANNRKNRQFSHLYRRRLQALGGPTKRAAVQQWQTLGYRFAEQAVQISIGEKIALVGIVSKRMKKMPDILNELSLAEKGVVSDFALAADDDQDDDGAQPASANYVSEDDTVILEDRSGRIALGGAIDPSLIVPGVVMGFRGTVEKGPVLIVDGCCFPGFAPQPSLPIVDLSGPTQEYVLFVSGLGFGSANFDPLRTKMLLDFVSGNLGGRGDARRSACISRVVLAGRSMFTGRNPRVLEGAAARKDQNKLKLVEPMTDLDHFLARLSATVAVDLLPGAGEPTNALQPQQAFHRCLFPNAARFSSFRSVPNPHSFLQSGATVIATAGQPISDLRQYISPDVSVCDAMESTLRLRHIAPSAPDSLSAFPLYDKVCFIFADFRCHRVCM